MSTNTRTITSTYLQSTQIHVGVGKDLVESRCPIVLFLIYKIILRALSLGDCRGIVFAAYMAHIHILRVCSLIVCETSYGGDSVYRVLLDSEETCRLSILVLHRSTGVKP